MPPAAPGGHLAEWTRVQAWQPISPFVLWRAAYLMQSGRAARPARHRFIDHWFYAFPAGAVRWFPMARGTTT